MNSIVVAVASSLIGNVFLLLLAIFLARTVEIEEYGTFRYFFNYITIAVGLLSLGRESLLAIKCQKESVNKLLTQELVFTVGLAGLISVIYCFILIHIDSSIEVDYLLYSLFLVLGYISYNLVTTGIRARGFVNESFVLVGLIQRVVRLLIVVICVYLIADTEGIFLGYVVSQLVLLVLVFYRIYIHGFRLKLTSISFEDYYRSYKEGNVYALIALSFVLFIHVDSIMLGYLANMESVAIYDIGFSIAIFGFFPFTALIKTSEIMSDKIFIRDDVSKKYYRNMDVALKLGFVISLGGVLFGKYFIQVFGDEYMGSYDVLAILIIGFFVYGFFGTPVEILAWNKNRKAVGILIVACFIFNILLNTYLIPLYKEEGAAIASVLSMCLLRLISTILVWKRIHIKSSGNINFLVAGLAVLLLNLFIGNYLNFIELMILFILETVPLIISERKILRSCYR